MKWNDVYVAGIGAYLPPARSVADAVAAGELTEERRDALTGYESVLVSDGLAGPELAVLAAKDAIAMAGIPAEEYGQAFNAIAWYEGRSMWAAATYVAGQSLSMKVPAFDVRNRCNGGMATLDLGCAFTASGARGSAVLLTNGDRFASPAVDRWTTHGKAFYGDAGTAMVLSRNGGFAKVLSCVTHSDNLFEGMARGSVPLDECPPSPDVPLNLAERYKEFMADRKPEDNYTRIFGTVQECRDQALDEAGVKLGDLRRVVDQATHGGMPAEVFKYIYGFGEELSTWDFGKRTGHLGAGDQFAGLHHLLATGGLAAGDVVLLLGGGAGFTCTAAVLEILEVPAFAS